jgi:hypothetical protein
MLPIIASMMWHRKVGNTIYLRERGLIFRPKTVKFPAYLREYSDLTKHLTELASGSSYEP